MSTKVRLTLSRLIRKLGAASNPATEVNQLLNKEGVPGAMDGAIDGAVDTEVNKLEKDF
jgi:hypothetical protein